MNYFERVSYIFSLQSKDVLDLSEQTLDSEALSYRDSDLTRNLPEDECISQSDRERETHPESGLPIYTMDEVSYHDTYDDCWIILYDKVNTSRPNPNF